MKKKSIYALLFAVILGGTLLGGCSKGTAEPVEREEIQETEEDVKDEGEDSEGGEEDAIDDGRFHGKWVVDAEYAAGRVGAKDTVFVDGRGEKQAILGTVEGAVATVWQDWSVQEGKEGDENWGRIQSPEVLSQTLGNLGITKDKEVILLGETLEGWGDDARLLWELLAAGYTDVKMVDGGLSAVKEAGAATQLFASRPEPSEVRVTEIDNSHVMSKIGRAHV